MVKGIEEKLVIGAGALGLIFLAVRAIRLVWAGVVLVRKKPAKGGEGDPEV